MIAALVFRPHQRDDPKYVRSVFIRRGLAEEWQVFDPVLKDREPAIDTTNNEYRIGDGQSRWSELPVDTPDDALNLIIGAVPNK